jgi:hypothetical protein
MPALLFLLLKKLTEAIRERKRFLFITSQSAAGVAFSPHRCHRTVSTKTSAPQRSRFLPLMRSMIEPNGRLRHSAGKSAVTGQRIRRPFQMRQDMKNLLTAAFTAGTLLTLAPAPSDAGVIERACRQADRTAATPSLCRCIQRVANKSLKASERRKVAKWFEDPHQAQVVRQSDKRSDERLWKRYRAFGEKAERSCG